MTLAVVLCLAAAGFLLLLGAGFAWLDWRDARARGRRRAR